MNRRAKVTLSQKFYLALSVLIIYFPIMMYVNMPSDRIISGLRFMIFPALITLLFYFLLILFIEWSIDQIVKIFGEKFLIEFKFPAQLLAIPVAIIATVFSNLLFSYSFKGIGHFFTPPAKEVRVTEEMKKKFEAITPEQMAYWKRTNNGMTMLIVLSIFYLAINRKANIKMKDMEVLAAQLKKENALAQFEALKNQVSPHFLFNSLSILSSLVHFDANLSEKFIDQLSKAYRYILEHKDSDSISLATELEFIQSYAFLLKIRFENKFDLQVEVPEEEANKHKIAPLTLQLLVENSIKHNRMTSKEPLEVRVYLEEGYLVVKNAIRPRQQKEISTGIGLQNIINRYHLLTTRPVEVKESNDSFVVKIPLLS